jgi:hypothetical protein
MDEKLRAFLVDLEAFLMQAQRPLQRTGQRALANELHRRRNAITGFLEASAPPPTAKPIPAPEPEPAPAPKPKKLAKVYTQYLQSGNNA